MKDFADNDFPERKQAEETFASRRQLLEIFFENSLTLNAILDADFNFIRVNKAYAEADGRKPEDFPGHNHFELYPSDAKPIFEQVVATGQSYQAHARPFVYADHPGRGTTYWDWTLVPITDSRGKVELLIFSLRNVTEQQLATKALLESEARLKEAQQIARIGNWDWDVDTSVDWWSEECHRIFNTDPKESPPAFHDHLKVYTPESARKLDTAVQRALLTGEPYELDLELAGKGGPTRWITTRGEVRRDGRGRITGLRGTVQNITERKRALDALMERESFIRNILETVDEGFLVLDRDHRILSANRAFCSMLHQPEDAVLGKFCHEVSHQSASPCFELGQNCPVRRAIDTGTSHSAMHTHTDAHGRKIHVELKTYPIIDKFGAVVSVIETVNDVTEKRKLEEQLRQAQKMEAVGRLTGGVAHDFNNMLTSIIGYSELALTNNDLSERLREELEIICEAGKKAAELTRQLLAFGRKQVLEVGAVNLNDVARDLLKLLEVTLGEDIEIVFRANARKGLVLADQSQLEQVLMNLAVNARDAMPDGGKMCFETADVVLGEEDGDTAEVKPGTYVLLTVGDTGCGMDRETLSRIFDPFFTTKEPGKGTGLGLATVHGIVSQHNGYIHAYSEIGKGTVFKIYWPVAEKVSEAVAATRDMGALHGSEMILVVDDEPTILELVCRTLARSGYRYVSATGGREALALPPELLREVDLLLTDVIMPEMNGRELAEKMRERFPELKVIYMSGYTDDVIARHGVLEEGNHLQKPLFPSTLLKKIRAALEG